MGQILSSALKGFKPKIIPSQITILTESLVFGQVRTLAESFRQDYSPNLMNKVCSEVRGVLGVSHSGFRRSAV